MSDASSPSPPALRERRERTIETLIAHFAADHITVEELEKRLDRAHRALQPSDLEALSSDLPALAPTPAVEAANPAAPRPTISPDAVREQQLLVAIMGGVNRRGQWVPARRTILFAFMGGAQLDFREAVLAQGVTEVSIFAICGGAEIIVPPGINIDMGGVAIMGGFEYNAGPRPADPSMPTLRVDGFALMGGVEVKVRYPGETPGDERRRRREERKQLRRGRQ